MSSPPYIKNGAGVRVAGAVIVRQRPGTANGIIDENLPPTLVTEPYLLVEGKIQNVDNVIHVLARRVERIEPITPAVSSHNFK